MKKTINIFLMLIMLTCLGVSNVQAAETVEDANLAKYFSGFASGTFVMYDAKNDRYTIYNLEQSKKPLSPCSTFKIYSSLIGLETGVLSKDNDTTLLEWDGGQYSIPSWHQNHTLASATKNSVVWYFQKVVEKIGAERMQKYLNEINYGNKDISSGLTTFWLDESLKISAQQQVKLLRKLYDYQLPFNPENIQIVKQNINLINTADNIFAGKTGSNGSSLGWFVGYATKGNNEYFFAVNIEGQGEVSGSVAREISRAILQEYEILPY